MKIQEQNNPNLFPLYVTAIRDSAIPRATLVATAHGLAVQQALKTNSNTPSLKPLLELPRILKITLCTSGATIAPIFILNQMQKHHLLENDAKTKKWTLAGLTAICNIGFIQGAYNEIQEGLTSNKNPKKNGIKTLLLTSPIAGLRELGAIGAASAFASDTEKYLEKTKTPYPHIVAPIINGIFGAIATQSLHVYTITINRNLECEKPTYKMPSFQQTLKLTQLTMPYRICVIPGTVLIIHHSCGELTKRIIHSQ